MSLLNKKLSVIQCVVYLFYHNSTKMLDMNAILCQSLAQVQQKLQIAAFEISKENSVRQKCQKLLTTYSSNSSNVSSLLNFFNFKIWKITLSGSGIIFLINSRRSVQISDINVNLTYTPTLYTPHSTEIKYNMMRHLKPHHQRTLLTLLTLHSLYILFCTPSFP